MHTVIRIYTQIHVQPSADRVALNLEIISKNFQLAPGEPGFSWDVRFITWY